MRQEYEYAGLGNSDSTGATLIRCCNGFTDIVVIVVVLAEDDDVLADPLFTVIGMRPAVKLPPLEPVDGDECDEDDDDEGEPIELLLLCCMSGECTDAILFGVKLEFCTFRPTNFVTCC